MREKNLRSIFDTNDRMHPIVSVWVVIYVAVRFARTSAASNAIKGALNIHYLIIEEKKFLRNIRKLTRHSQACNTIL